MRFSEDFRNSVGFILEEDEPIGTFFLIQSRVHPPRDGRNVTVHFMVTARHCVDSNKSPKARYRGALLDDADLLESTPEWPVPEWRMPPDPSIDLAIALFEPPEDMRGRMRPKVIPAEMLATPSVGRYIELGELVYYVGLWDISADGNRGAVPVVRSATVAALNERNIRWEDDDTAGVWPNGHLIDVKSKAGFSGGPVFIQRLVTRAWRDQDLPLPDLWMRRAQRAGTDMATLGEVTTYTDLWGMFVGHADESGIGVVLPIEDILGFIEAAMET